MSDFRVSKAARTDIRDIGFYTQKQWGKAQRYSYLDGLEKCFFQLAENPSLAAERTEFIPPVRIFPYQQHLVIYTVQENGIYIFRILHKSMDVPESVHPV